MFHVARQYATDADLLNKRLLPRHHKHRDTKYKRDETLEAYMALVRTLKFAYYTL